MTPDQRALLADVARICVESMRYDAMHPRLRRPMRCTVCGKERVGCKLTACKCGGWMRYDDKSKSN